MAAEMPELALHEFHMHLAAFQEQERAEQAHAEAQRAQQQEQERQQLLLREQQKKLQELKRQQQLDMQKQAQQRQQQLLKEQQEKQAEAKRKHQEQQQKQKDTQKFGAERPKEDERQTQTQPPSAAAEAATASAAAAAAAAAVAAAAAKQITLGLSFSKCEEGGMKVTRLKDAGCAALHGGIQVGDRVLTINGENLADKSALQLNKLLSGPEHSQAVLQVVKSGQVEAVTMVIKRHLALSGKIGFGVVQR